MRPSDRMLLVELTEHLKSLTAAVAEVRETQRGIERRLSAIEAGVETNRKASDVFARTGFAQVEDLLALYRLVDTTEALPRMRDFAAGPELMRFLCEEAASRGGARVLECGSGTTTVVLAYVMRSLGAGHIMALEHDPHYAAQTRREIETRGLGEWATIVDAPLTAVNLDGEVWRWYDTTALPDGQVEMLLVDGPPAATGPQARYPALPVLAGRLTKEALVVLDDANRPDERAIAARWSTEFDEFQHERLAHDRGTVLLRR